VSLLPRTDADPAGAEGLPSEQVGGQVRDHGASPDRPPEAHGLPEVARAVAIIMDGNGRWASAQGVGVAEGHRAGSRALRPVVETAIDLGVESLAVYAFSTENWSRSADEVEALMEIFGETIDRELHDLAKEGVRTRFVGRRDRAPDWLQTKLDDLETATADKTRLSLWIAFDYGGRAELVEAARRIAESGVDPEDIDEASFALHLYAPDMPDPDLVIRTSGELRVSNFLLWQSAYAEFVFVDTLWPDFGPNEFRAAIEDYASRRRRFGGR
jgi:undecaprenyl diphosphate synthase